MTIENFIRPFQTVERGPARFFQPGQVGVPPVRRSIGLIGGTKTFAYSLDYNSTLYMAQINTEDAPRFAWPLAGG